ncbi:DUF3298 domain-containing protein [Paenibacillus piri]|uniref:DUF3298 domain-containing protein n=2 Tax=Paenibacillus piri TaxID=2547395 RepID=A0A4R5L001_9BACL|nr:DUF3298 domain-containing protein [Paenibacillus piri]
MPGAAGQGQAEIALWQHDTGEAYRVQVVIWRNGAFVPAPDAYAYYFPKAVRYYEQQVRQHPDYAFYWYYLADAQLKSGMQQQAAASIRKGRSLNKPYPTEAQWQELEAQLPSARATAGLEADTSAERETGVDSNPNSVLNAVPNSVPFMELASHPPDSPYTSVYTNMYTNPYANMYMNTYNNLYTNMPTNPFANLNANLHADPFADLDAQINMSSNEAISAVVNPEMLKDMPRAVSLFPASVKTTSGIRWGFIDSKGAMALRPQYEYAFDFQTNGLAVVQAHGHNGLINASGQYVAKPVYNSISPFSEGRAVVIDNRGFRVIDEKGRFVTRKAYGYIGSYKNGRAVFSIQSGGQSRYGYLDLQGSEAIAPQFVEAGDFDRNKAVVKIKDNEYALIGLDGARLAVYPFASVGPLGDGLLSFQEKAQGKYGYIDEKGTVVIQPAFTDALPFQDGRAVVNTAEGYKATYGLIDKQGGYIIQPSYNEIRILGEQRLALGKAIHADKPYMGSIFAIADTNGQLLSDFVYRDVSDFRKGLASVTDGKQTYFIDRSGKAAYGFPKVEGSGTLIWQNPLIQANIDQRLTYLNRAGRIVWQQNTVIPLRLTYKVKEIKYKPNRDYLVYYPQLEGMLDKAAQQRVNELLKEKSNVKPVPADTQLDSSYSGDFEVAFFKQDLLVLELNSYNFPFGAAHGMPGKMHVHVNVANGHTYTLNDLFRPGSNYVQVLSDIVGRQIKEDPQYSYVFPGSYKGIKPNQPFYVTDHALHLYFYPYEIAPYVAGFPTFTIPFTEIMSLIAVQGEFWQSFHK